MAGGAGTADKLSPIVRTRKVEIIPNLHFHPPFFVRLSLFFYLADKAGYVALIF